MLTTRMRHLTALTAALLIGGFNSYAQTGSAQTDAYSAQLRNENRRHADVTTKLKNDRLDAQKQCIDEEIDCSANPSPAGRKTCQETPRNNLDKAIRKIEKDENAERTLHAKNLNNLERSMDEACTRPDCANGSPGQKNHCTDGSCR